MNSSFHKFKTRKKQINMPIKSFFLLSILFSTLSINAQDVSEEKTNNPCDIIPGQVEAFKNALTDSKLHYYTNGGTIKLDLKKAELECNQDYFTISNGALVLTSPGQKKDRVEIRQDKNLSLNDYSAMDFSASYEDVPSSNERKGVTIGQIHNDTKGVKRPLLRVEIAGGNQIRVIVTESYLKGKGNTTNDFLVSFKEKNHIDCKIEINDSSNKVSVIVKNNTTGEEKAKTYKVSKLWRQMDGQFYFKAGAYTQVSGPKTKVSYNKFDFIY